MKRSTIKVDNPGVYWFKKGREILYVGKATSLRSRVRSYFGAGIALTRSSWIAKMVAEATRVDYIVTDSVLEALILEANLIKKHQPKYNAKEKDDKSYLYVIIIKEDFPRLLMLRGKELASLSVQKNNFRGFTRSAGSDADKNSSLAVHAAFGPFPHGSELREALKIVRKIFPFRDKCRVGQGKPCFDAQIGLCPGVCSGAISKTDYARTIRHLKLFFAGRKSQLLKQLAREMKRLAKAQKFEQAGETKKQIFALQHIQDVALIKKENPNDKYPISNGFRIESYDVAHLSGKNTVGAMVVAVDGELDKNGYRRFKLKGAKAKSADDTANLAEILERRLNHPEWLFPNLVLVDGGKAQINTARAILNKRKLAIPVMGVIKNKHHRARMILGDKRLAKQHHSTILHLNAEAHRFATSYHRKLRRQIV